MELENRNDSLEAIIRSGCNSPDDTERLFSSPISSMKAPRQQNRTPYLTKKFYPIVNF